VIVFYEGKRAALTYCLIVCLAAASTYGRLIAGSAGKATVTAMIGVFCMWRLIQIARGKKLKEPS